MAFGAAFTAGDFNVKLRFSGLFLGKTTNHTTNIVTEKLPGVIGFGLYPNYKVSGNLHVGVGFDVMVHGLGTPADGDWGGPEFQSVVRWHASPVVRYTVGGGEFLVGMNIGAPDGKQQSLKWEVPIRMGYSF